MALAKFHRPVRVAASDSPGRQPPPVAPLPEQHRPAAQRLVMPDGLTGPDGGGGVRHTHLYRNQKPWRKPVGIAPSWRGGLWITTLSCI
jgi:hypothetical protein